MKSLIRKIKIKAAILTIILVIFSSVVIANDYVEKQKLSLTEDGDKYVVSFPKLHPVTKRFTDMNYLGEIKIKDMLVSTNKIPGYGYATVFKSGTDIFRTTMVGEYEFITDYDGHGIIKHLANGLRDDWLVITDEGEFETAYYYESTEDLQNDNHIAMMSDLYSPLNGAVVEFTESWNNRGFLWGEYSIDEGYDCRIIRVVYDGSDAVFNVELTVPDETARHFHGIDVDIYDEGVFYAYMGDLDHETRWFKSTDYGDSWELLEGTSGSQTYRTCRLVFTEDYIYWTTDGFCDNGYSQLLRTQRSDVGNYEVVADLSATCLSMGCCLVWSPYGIIVPLVDMRSNDLDSIPMYFYDLNTDQLVKIYEWKTKDDYGRSAGVRSTMPYQDIYNGIVWVTVTNVDSEFYHKWSGSSSFYLSKGLIVSKIFSE